MKTPDPIRLTQDLIAINTINPPGNEAEAVAYLIPLLEEAGFRCEKVHHWGNSESLIARIGSGPYLCLTGHLDVVPLGKAEWEKEPFGGEIEGDKLYGRGSSDMKGGIAALVAASIEAAENLGTKANLLLVLTAYEETGCRGAWDLAERELLKDKVEAILVCEPTGNKADLGHKGSIWFEATVKGVTAHGSMPHLGENAIYKACEKILALRDLDFEHEPHPLYGPPTINIGTLNSGININSVPDRASFTIDIRTVPPMSHLLVEEKVAQILGPEVELKVINSVPHVEVDPDDPWVNSVLDRVEQVTKENPHPLKGGVYVTDASVLWRAYGHPPVLVLGPGELDQAHKTDEYCLVSKLAQAVQLYGLIIGDWSERISKL